MSGFPEMKKIRHGKETPKRTSGMVRTVLLAVLIFLMPVSGCKRSLPVKSVQIFALDTFVSITAEGQQAQEAVTEGAALVTSLEQKLSRHIEGSPLWDLNHSSERSPVELPQEVYSLLEETLEFSKKTDGIFDPTIGALMDVWDFGKNRSTLPPKEKIDEALQTVDVGKIHLLSGHFAYVEEGTVVDLGGVAKGYIADQVMDKMKSFSVTRIVLDLGGNVCGWAKDRDLKIGVVSPLEANKMICILKLNGCSVITSGAYERFLQIGEEKYGHIMDTSAGYPVSTDLLSATVVTEDGTAGDIYSTTLYALGKESAMDMSRRAGINCILCTGDGTLWVSEELRGKIDAQPGWTIEYFG